MKTRIKKISALVSAVAMTLSMFTFNAQANEVTNNDIRFDFIADNEGFKGIQNKLNPTRTVKSGWYIMSVNDAPTSGPVEQMGYEIGDINLGDGGYYMHVKEDINIISPAWCSGEITNVSGTNVSGTTDSVTGVKTFNLTAYTGVQKIKRLYNLSESTATVHAGSISVDWIVFSKNPTLTEETAMITSINDVVLSQNGDETEMEVAASVYNAVAEGSIDGLPEGFSAVPSSDVSDITYSTNVTDCVTHKVLDITATGKKNEVDVNRQYRLVLKKFTPDIRYDFLENAEGVLSKDYIFVADHKMIDGQYVMSINQVPDTTKNEQIGFKINPVDFGDGGYYMHVKESWNFTSPVKVSGIATLSAEVRDDKWGTSIANESPNKSTDNSIRTYDLRNVKGCKEIRRIYTINDGKVSNVEGNISVDWVVFSKNATLSDAVIKSMGYGSMGCANPVSLAQDGSISEIKAMKNTDFYNNVSTIVNGLPQGISAKANTGISNLACYSVVANNENYKLVDIYATGVKDSQEIYKQYRVKIVPTDVIPEQNIRYDFMESNGGLVSKDYLISSTHAVENGQYVMKAENVVPTSGVDQLSFLINSVDFGEGGYYMHVKENWNFDEPVKVSAIHSIVSGATVRLEEPHLVSNSAIKTYDFTGYTGEQSVRRVYNISEGSADNVNGSIAIDWIVFSKDKELPENFNIKSTLSNSENTWTACVESELEHAASQKNAVIILAGYDKDGALVKMDMTDNIITIAGSNVASDNTYFRDDSLEISDDKITNAKIFVWNSIEGMVPLMPATDK